VNIVNDACSSGNSTLIARGRLRAPQLTAEDSGARTIFAIEIDRAHAQWRFHLTVLLQRRSNMAASALRDRRILVVEDEYLVAMSLRDVLESVGSVVVGPVPSVEMALETIASEPQIDAAILDINLGGVKAYPVADMLLARSIPFIFTSGYEEHVLRARYPKIRNCQKPCPFPKMEEALAAAMSTRKRSGGP
jgi:CheY-like chemotaxis protein